jgi:hypothetical protein
VPEPWAEADLAALAGAVDAWATRQAEENPVVDAVERDDNRWWIRVRGEEKDVFTIWFELGQRTLRYETYVMPAPEENEAAFYEHLLRRNRRFYGAAFCIGDEDAVFLAGQVANESITDDELDRVLGSLYAWTEQCFRPALRIGFATRFASQ